MLTYIERREKTDAALIETVVESMGVLPDLRLFDALTSLMAEEVTVDYTSLLGGEVRKAAPRELIYHWKESLCGFDATRHKLRNIKVELKGQEATAKADASATYFLDEHIWEVKGTYHFALRFHHDGWKITGLNFVFTEETGSRDVLTRAKEIADRKGKCDMTK